MAAFITAQRAQHRVPTATSCRALGVSAAWYYKWRDGDPSRRRARRAALAAQVARLFAAHHGRYGSPRITAELRAAGWRVSVNTVTALMREQVWSLDAPADEINYPVNVACRATRRQVAVRPQAQMGNPIARCPRSVWLPARQRRPRRRSCPGWSTHYLDR